MNFLNAGLLRFTASLRRVIPFGLRKVPAFTGRGWSQTTRLQQSIREPKEARRLFERRCERIDPQTRFFDFSPSCFDGCDLSISFRTTQFAHDHVSRGEGSRILTQFRLSQRDTL
jgi:hypothetical protein